MIVWQQSIEAHPPCFILSRYRLSVVSLHGQARGWVTFSAACIRAVVPFFCRPFTLTPFFISNRRMSSCPPAAANMLRDMPLTSCRHTDTKLQCQIRAAERAASEWLAVDVRLLFGAKRSDSSWKPWLNTAGTTKRLHSEPLNTRYNTRLFNGETGWHLVIGWLRLVKHHCNPLSRTAEGAANRCRTIRT